MSCGTSARCRGIADRASLFERNAFRHGNGRGRIERFASLAFDARCSALRNFPTITDTSDARRTRLFRNSIPIHSIRLRMRASRPSLSLSLCTVNVFYAPGATGGRSLRARSLVNHARTRARARKRIGCVTRGAPHAGFARVIARSAQHERGEVGRLIRL